MTFHHVSFTINGNSSFMTSSMCMRCSPCIGDYVLNCCQKCQNSQHSLKAVSVRWQVLSQCSSDGVCLFHRFSQLCCSLGYPAAGFFRGVRSYFFHFMSSGIFCWMRIQTLLTFLYKLQKLFNRNLKEELILTVYNVPLERRCCPAWSRGGHDGITYKFLKRFWWMKLNYVMHALRKFNLGGKLI